VHVVYQIGSAVVISYVACPVGGDDLGGAFYLRYMATVVALRLDFELIALLITDLDISRCRTPYLRHCRKFEFFGVLVVSIKIVCTNRLR
jgi:hypothetical protein